jgi:Spy/CpxP family protein refolding chaperone
MRRAHTLFLVLTVLSTQPAAAEATDGAPAPPQEAPMTVPGEPAHGDRLRDYVDQVRAQRRAQIERLRAESRDDSERAWQQHRESVEEQSRLRREQLERRWDPQFPIGAPSAGEWSNPWYYRGW